MMMLREEIKNLIQKSIIEVQKESSLPNFELPTVSIEIPAEKKFGDYTTNVAMVISRILRENRPSLDEADFGRRSPMEIANLIRLKFKAQSAKLFEKIEIVDPGFINFFLSREYLQKQVGGILKGGEKFGRLKLGRNIKTQVEFISANPVGSLHIGNGRGAFFGDTLANVLNWAGFKVSREFYINDAKVNTQIKLLGQTAVGEGATYLNEYIRSKIQNSKFKIQNYKSKFKNKEKLYGEAGYLLAKEVQKDNKDFIENKLKIKFDNWVSEEDFYKKSKIVKIYLFLVKKGLVYTQHSLLSWFKAESFVNFPPEPYKVAHWLKTKEFGDSKDEVIIRETGEPTYFLSDITYHQDKFARGFKKIINIWGADHQGHVPKIKAAAKILGYKGDLDPLISQVVRLKRGKISKRKGVYITLAELIEDVGLDAARFFYLAKSLNTQMEFDLDLAKEQSEKNPVYYIQYAYARICSILRKCKMQNAKIKMKIPRRSRLSATLRGRQNLKLLEHPSELELIKQLIRFPEIIEDTANDYQVQRIPQYALDLATSFHQFYRDCRVLTEAQPLTEVRLALILATKQVIKNTLGLMGISAPERM